ncbi:MAG: Rieske 2Fe-2S domain-containing protein [Chloroflexi bacterium]|nr:Rieske 2Fe-2S domain-containing protein [Chloroflexota bacterium]
MAKSTASERPFPYHTMNFPYQRTLDALVTRRDYLRLLVLTSFGLFVGTAGVAGAALLNGPTAYPRTRVAEAAALPAGKALNFVYPTADDPAILVHLPDGRFRAFSQTCTHLACPVFWNAARGRLVCPCHEGIFDAETGLVVAGPPPRPLPRIALQAEQGSIYAVGVTR